MIFSNMRKTIQYFFLAAASIMLLQSCKKTIYKQLTDDEVSYLVYKQDELIIFARSSSAVDTYRVSARNRSYTIDKPYYNEVAAVNFYKVNDTLKVGVTSGLIKLTKNNNNEFT